MRILCAAENFAYGPAGKLLTVGRELRARGHELAFVGMGTAFDLASKSDVFSDVVHADTDSHDFALEHHELLCGTEVVVSAMDRGAIVAAAARGIPTVWIDSLFYWWEELPEAVLAADLYIKQDVLPDENGMERFASRIRNLRSVGPIVERSETSACGGTGQLLISFGGMEAPGWYESGKNHNYPKAVTRLVLEGVELGAYDHVLFTGSSSIMAELRTSFATPSVQFESLDHDDFVSTLRLSDVVLLPGGMESTLEAFANGVPAVFLPPVNVTHHLHVMAFRERGIAQSSIGLCDYLDLPNWDGLSRREKVDSFMKIARYWQANEAITSDMARRIDVWLGDVVGLQVQQREQHRFLQSLAADGTNQVVDSIEGIFSTRGSLAPSTAGSAS